MDHKYCLYMFIGFFPLLINLIILTFLVETVLSAENLKFKACEPKKCGTNLTISYPFWIPDEQESYCGHPDFQILCTDNEEPILRLSDEDYLIRNIYYENQSVLVANADTYHDSCPTPLRNFTDVDPPFSFGPYHVELFFFYNCSLVPTEYFKYDIDCVKNTTQNNHYSYATVLHHGGLQYLNASSEKCESFVGVPIEGVMELYPMMKMDYSELLRNGFYLEWNLSSSYCKECVESGGHCGLEDNKFICFCQDKSHPKSCKNGKDNKGRKVGIGIGAAAGGSLLTMILAFFLFRRWRRKNKFDTSSTLMSRSISPDLSMKQDPEKGSTYFQTPIFSYKELEEATNNFDSNKELGDGGFGTVYHGELRDRRVVAVKRLYENNCKRVEQFMNEVTILSLLRHQNLVTLYGCTSRHSRELLLVYEYVPNGTVADHLHGEQAKSGLLTWPIRMSIAIESAGALAYLHASDIVHRDVKTNNILLDNNFHVKVADFGLSRLFPTDVTHVSTAPQGTPGYVDPEYYQCYQLTEKSDVYSFGVVLIELISSMPAVDINRHRHEINLSNMAINKIHNHALHELVDSSLGFDKDPGVRRMITLVAELAFRCLQQETEMRPTMAEVVEVLKGIASEGSKVVKGVEVDIPAEDVRLLKNIEPLSPDSVTDKWVSSVSTTPNTSS